MKKTSTILLFLLAIATFSALSAAASTCVPLGSYQLASPCNPASFKIYGNGPSGQSVGTTQGLITGSSFQVGFDNNSSTSDVLIIGVFSNHVISGTLNNINFSAPIADPFDANHDGAIASTLSGLGFPGNNLAYAWLDLGKGVTSGGKLTVDMSGIASGVIFYAEAVDPFTVVIGTQTICDAYNKKGKCIKSHTVDITTTQLKIDNVNANSEAGITRFRPPSVPEPASFLLLGSSLLGLALRRRRGQA